MAETDQDTCFRKLWWERSDLMREQGRLMLEGMDVQRIAEDCGTPAYVYNRNRIGANVSRLLQALDSAHPRSRLFYAMKSNRYEPILRWLAGLGNVGIDACSPGEMDLALQCGFREEQISFTATGMGYREWESVLQHADVMINADSFGDIRKIGQISPGSQDSSPSHPLKRDRSSNDHCCRFQCVSSSTSGIPIPPPRFRYSNCGNRSVNPLSLSISCAY